MRVLVLPYLSDEQQEAARDTSRAVEGWAAGADLTLITVTGLTPAFSLVVAQATTLGEAERLLAHRRRRDRLTAELPAVAGEILRLDGLARQEEARDALDRATERYGVARDVLTRDGDLTVADDALRSAQGDLATARSELSR